MHLNVEPSLLVTMCYECMMWGKEDMPVTVGEMQVVPEFIQENAEASRVADAAFNMLAISNSGCRERVLEGYQELHGLLGMPGVAKRTAQLVLSSICADN